MSSHPSTYEFLAQRRSASVLVEPHPNRAEIEKILQVAGSVPDHGMLRPYRFVIVEGDSRDRFGEALVNAANENRGAPLDLSQTPKVKAKAFAAPMQILIIFSPQDSNKIPEWEQMAAASCTGYAVDLAANALGYGAVWKSFAYNPGSQLKQMLQLADKEKFLGWINIGTEKEKARSAGARDPLDLSKHALFIR